MMYAAVHINMKKNSANKQVICTVNSMFTHKFNINSDKGNQITCNTIRPEGYNKKN